MTHVWTGGRIAITLGILAYVLRGIDLGQAVTALRQFSGIWIEETLLLIAIDRLLMLWRWSILIKAGITRPPTSLVRIFFVSSFLGSFLPAGVGGDAARAYRVGRQSGELSAAVASVVVDRWLGLMAVGLAGCAGVLTSFGAIPDELRELTVVLTLAILVAGLATMFADRLIAGLVPSRVLETNTGMQLTRLAQALAVYRQRPRTLWQVGTLSLLVQAVRIVMAWVIGVGLGISLPFSYYWIFMPLNILVILLPLSLGGFGLPQGTMVWTLGPLGVPATQAFLLSLLFVLAGIVGNLPGAVLYACGPSPDTAAQRERPR